MRCICSQFNLNVQVRGCLLKVRRMTSANQLNDK